MVLIYATSPHCFPYIFLCHTWFFYLFSGILLLFQLFQCVIFPDTRIKTVPYWILRNYINRRIHTCMWAQTHTHIHVLHWKHRYYYVFYFIQILSSVFCLYSRHLCIHLFFAPPSWILLGSETHCLFNWLPVSLFSNQRKSN